MNPTLGTSQNWGEKKNKENHCYLVSLLVMILFYAKQALNSQEIEIDQKWICTCKLTLTFTLASSLEDSLWLNQHLYWHHTKNKTPSVAPMELLNNVWCMSLLNVVIFVICLHRFISSLTFTKFDLTNLPQHHLMLCSLRWSRDQHSLVSLFPMRPVVLFMHYLALKRLLSAARRILNEGDARSGQSVQPAKRLQQTQWAGLEDTADLMGLSMCDDRYLSFEWVRVLGLTFVIKAGSGLRDTFQVDCCIGYFQRNTH